MKLPNGAPGAIRTRGTRFRRAVLYPLSYGGVGDIVALSFLLWCEEQRSRMVVLMADTGCGLTELDS